MTERAAPFYCPYCGDEDLRPHERSEGAPAGLTEERAQERGTSDEHATREGGGRRMSAATHPAQEDPHAAWLCTGCRRVFTVKFVGLNLAKEEVTK
jgi:hypothetical protein